MVAVAMTLAVDSTDGGGGDDPAGGDPDWRYENGVWTNGTDIINGPPNETGTMTDEEMAGAWETGDYTWGGDLGGGGSTDVGSTGDGGGDTETNPDDGGDDNTPPLTGPITHVLGGGSVVGGTSGGGNSTGGGTSTGGTDGGNGTGTGTGYGYWHWHRNREWKWLG